MSSLQRYKKSGGFVQLLSLLETFGPQKKEKFLEMIEAESPVWATALREKMLTLERILKWPDQVVLEVFKQLPLKNQAIAIRQIQPEQRARLEPFYSVSEKRKMDDALGETPLKPEEAAASMVKLIEFTRKMLNEKQIHAEKFDESLLVPEDFEAKLEERDFGGHGGGDHGHPPAEVQAVLQAVTANSAQAPTLETAQLQRTLALMVKENKALKDEVRVLRDKLEQIKRIA